ncbi:condensation domain-containing protein [Nocardia sp. NPDC056952]|uniref:condensation domain-containing protein n=1 Tax=Nocardia sp. NPDC056952 TaxID=3345979 RepID=UPI00363A3F01
MTSSWHTPDLRKRHRVVSPVQLAILGAEAWAKSDNPAAYTVVSAVRAKGIPNWSELVAAVSSTLTRHDVLTWRFSYDESFSLVASGGVSGVSAHFSIEEVDLTDLDFSEAETQAADRLHRERHRVIDLLDLHCYPHTRAILFRLSGGADSGNAICALVTHHAFVDERAVELIWVEVFERSTGTVRFREEDLRYSDWAARSVTPESKSEAKRDAEEIVHSVYLGRGALSKISAEEVASTAQAGSLRFSIPRWLDRAVENRAAGMAVSESAFFLVAYQRTVARYSATHPTVIVTPMSLRRQFSEMGIIGCFVSSIPIISATHFCADRSSVEAVESMQKAVSFAASHRFADIDLIRREMSGIQRVSLAFETRGVTRNTGPITWVSMPPPDSYAKFPISLFVARGSRWNTGEGRLSWKSKTLHEGAARNFVDDFISTLERLASE